ncbi:MAG: hypothetical protein ACI4HI_09435 [Lachnospiraceae bacterium]
MKKMKKVMFAIATFFLLALGCGKQESATTKAGSTNNVKNVLEQQMQAEPSEDGETMSDSQPEANTQKEEQKSDVDMDLTVMDRDMVYASVYQMMADPKSYEGKTIRIKGSYYAEYYDKTEKYYHYCLIKDAMACCAQGMEFIWDDGSHVYPDEYPPEDTEITVTGIFETYQEEGDGQVYARLKNANMAY